MTDPARAAVLEISPDHIDAALVRRAGEAIRAGRLVAIPTETVYGLACNALDERAVARVYEAKGRPASDPLIVHVDGVEMATTVIEGPMPPAAAALAAAFWPGPLTMVLPRNPRVPPSVTSGLGSVGVRCPSHPVAAAVIRAAGVPVAAPSANRFGHISPTSADHVLADLGDRIDLVVDSGRADRGVESTVVAFDDDQAVILRHGALTIEELGRHVAVRTVDPDDTASAAASPGHEDRHYAPRTPTIAVAPGTVTAGGVPASEYPVDVAYLGFADRRPSLPAAWRFVSLGPLTALDDVAHDLYDTLRRLDTERPGLIVVELTACPGIGRAIDDRLTRAASSIVVDTAEGLARAAERHRPPGERGPT